MKQYVKEGGRFEVAYEAMARGKEIPFQGVQNAKDGKNRVINRATRQKEGILARK